MEKHRPAGIDNQDYISWLAEISQRHDSHRSSAAREHRHVDRPSTNNSRDSAIILILGFVLLQLIALATVLLIVVPIEQQVANRNIKATSVPLPTNTPIPVFSGNPPPTATPAEPEPDVSVPAGSVDQIVESPEPAVEPPPSPTPQEPVALRLRAEITQGIQVFNDPEDPQCQPDPNHPNHVFCNNSIPMVAGRHTLVRVYPICNGDCPTTETIVQLRLLKDGQEQSSFTRHLSPGKLQQVNNLSLHNLRTTLEHSVNFEFFPPPGWMSGQVTFEFAAFPADPGQTPPAKLSLTKHFAIRKPLRIAYLPIEYQGLRAQEPTGFDYWLMRLYPLSSVEYYRLPMPDLVWDGELSKSELLRRLLYTYWLYAQHHPQEEWPDQLFGWLPQQFYNGGVSDPFWCPGCAGPHSSRVAFGGWRPEQDIGGPRILVHEIAHNLGAQHAWSPTQQQDAVCFRAEGADIRVDPQWPYAQTPHIQEFGIDLYSNPSVIYPPSYYDMMAYCARPWISPHTYRKLFDSPFLQPDADATLPLANFKPETKTIENGTLLVSGVIYPNGSVSQPEIIRLTGTAFDAGSSFNPSPQFIPPAGNDYCLDVRASDNSSLAQHCFDAGFLDLETGLATEASPYFFTLPNIDAEAVAKVSISQNDVPLVSITPSNTPPEVTVSFPNGGETLAGEEVITWEAHDADGEPLQYDLLYSPDGGQSWLPLAVRLSQNSYRFNAEQLAAGQDALVRVIASDGFHTSIDESDALFTIAAPLENSVSLLGSTAVKPGQTFEVELTANQMIAPGLFGLQFKLNFDPTLLRVDALRLHPDLTLVIDQSIQNDIGQVSVVASRHGDVPNLSGDIKIATVTLTALADEGQAQLYLSDLKAGARGGQQITISNTPELYLRIAN